MIPGACIGCGHQIWVAERIIAVILADLRHFGPNDLHEEVGFL